MSGRVVAETSGVQISRGVTYRSTWITLGIVVHQYPRGHRRPVSMKTIGLDGVSIRPTGIFLHLGAAPGLACDEIVVSQLLDDRVDVGGQVKLPSTRRIESIQSSQLPPRDGTLQLGPKRFSGPRNYRHGIIVSRS